MPMSHPFPQMAAPRSIGRSAAMRVASELMGEKDRREGDQRHCYHDAYH
jgi:hypothetical protein